MTVEAPDHFMGKPIPEDAIEIALAAEKKKKDGNLGGENTGVETPSLEGFIYVPSINLYVAKERTLLKHNWYDTHKKLHKQNLRMPTIPEFIEFLKYLRADLTGEHKQIYEEITEVGEPWRTEWLDADFKVINRVLHINYSHWTDSNGQLKPRNSEPLKDCLMSDKLISLDYWLDHATSQGLPPLNCISGDLHYYETMNDNESVARFGSDSPGTIFDCSRDPSGSGFTLGVFACAEKPGEKQ